MTGAADRRRVVVTGVGVVAANGIGVANYGRALRNCQSGIQPRETRSAHRPGSEPGSLTVPMAAIGEEIVVENDRWLSSFARFALHAALQAVADAGDVATTPGFPERTAVLMGTGMGGDDAREKGAARVYLNGSRPHPLTILRAMPNASTSAIAMALRITGPCLTVSTACASSSHAIGQALRMIQHGEADFALAGGSDELPGYGQLLAWQQMRVLSAKPCRPFAAARDGFTLGEGAAVLFLEELESARSRGARIYAELAGFALGADAADWTRSDPAGILRCMRAALADAAIQPDELGYINAHATGTSIGDATEAACIREILGPVEVPVSSTKPLHGHALGASGAMGAIAAILALREGWLPPMPATEPDETIRLPLVWQGDGQKWPGGRTAALANAFGFGGLNAALVFQSHTCR